MSDLIKEIGDFERHCVARGLVRKTAATYASHVRKYCELNGILCLDDFFRDTQRDYHEPLETLSIWLRAENDRSENTVNEYFCALDRFFSWEIYMGLTNINPVPFFRQNCVYFYKRRMPKQAYVPELEEMRDFLDFVDDPIIQSMLIVGCKAMLRKDELLSVRVSDVDLKHKMMMVKEHPKRQNCMVFLDDEAIRAVKTAIKFRCHDSNPYLFIKSPGRPYNRNNSRIELTRFAKDFGIYTEDGPRQLKFTWNSCRRFGVTRLKESGFDTDYIKWLRGDNMLNMDDMTIRYRAFDPKKIQAAYEEKVFKFWN